MKKDKKEIEAEAEAVRAALPDLPGENVKAEFMAEPYDDVVSIIRSEYFPDTNGKKIKVNGITCGHCRAKTYFKYEKDVEHLRENHGFDYDRQDEYAFFNEKEMNTLLSGNTFRCAFCGGTSTVYGYARMRNQNIAAKRRYAAEIKAVNGHAVVINWRLTKNINREGIEYYDCSREGAAFCIDGKMFRVTGYYYWYLGRYPADNWIFVQGNYKEGLGAVIKKYTYWNEDELSKTVEGNDGLFAFLKCGNDTRFIYAERYLNLWAKAHVIENIAKTYPNYTDLLIGKDITSAIFKQSKVFLNLKKTKPHEMIGLEKEEAKKIVESVQDPTKIYLYKICRENKVKDPVRMLSLTTDDADRIFNFLRDETTKSVDPPFEKCLNYCIKIIHRISSVRTLRDYWRMVLDTEETVDPSVMFPKDLTAAHDRAAERYQNMLNKSQDELIKKRARILNKYCFSDAETGLMIRPVKSTYELKKEGKELCHCVASYAKSVAQGTTNIFFVRKTDEPDKPFYTLEYDGKKIVQDHGYKNKLQTPEVLAFEAKWLSYIRGGLNDAKRNNDKSEQRAGA